MQESASFAIAFRQSWKALVEALSKFVLLITSFVNSIELSAKKNKEWGKRAGGCYVEPKVMAEGNQERPRDLVMVSYSHKDSCLARRIVEDLRYRGLNIWYDRDCLKEKTDMLDTMAEVVEQCSVMITLFSQSYKDSASTRMESQYASNLHKPVIFVRAQEKYRPDGWLGLLLGADIYIDLSGKYPYENKIDELYHRVMASLGKSPQTNSGEKEDKLTCVEKRSENWNLHYQLPGTDHYLWWDTKRVKKHFDQQGLKL
ncbi:hypothetical protein Ciccas_014082 [Cichlidogyrus casuarinus]|uniref:TIR domain-containing protein n=1 Tax=Cichlidogyrus casuarinus TaxID=1844966 RepID=A0ABD2PJZ8_9PLAT